MHYLYAKTFHLEDRLKYKFEEVYRTCYHKVRYFCFSYLDDHEQAVDVAQDVFMTLWENFATVDTGRDILPYLMTMARNRCLNILQRRKVKGRYEGNYARSFMDDINSFSLSEMAVSDLYSEEVGKILARSMDEMPEKVRESFVEIRLEDNKYKEVAEKQNVTVKTLEHRMSAAMSILRKNMRDYIKFIVLLLSGMN